MGIRTKILLTFILCFGLMAALGLYFLQRSMDESYSAIERRDIVASMARVEQGFEASAASLRNQTNDWAVWDEMRSYVLHPDKKWAQANLGQDALKPANLSMVMILTRNGKVVSVSVDGDSGQESVIATRYAEYIPLVSKSEPEARCGVVRDDANLLQWCWAGIVRSDGSGTPVGTVVMGRTLDAERLKVMRGQVRLPFELKPSTEMPAGLELWRGALEPGTIGSGDFWTSHEPNVYHLYYRVQDLLKRDVGLLTLDVSRNVHEQGVALYGQVRKQLIIGILIMTALLAAALHFLLISRLRRVAAELDDLSARSAWDSSIDVGGQDEIGAVARNVNRLLSLIHSQMEMLNTLSRTDPLSGLKNRRAFDESLAGECSRARRTGAPLTLICIDVDQFKRYNDYYGHPAGDAALEAVSSVLAGAIHRPADVVARIGGEEFAIVLPDTGADDARVLAEAIQARLRERALPHAASTVDQHLTLSIGVAGLKTGDTPASLIECADTALYAAKEAGRNRVIVSNLLSSSENPR